MHPDTETPVFDPAGKSDDNTGHCADSDNVLRHQILTADSAVACAWRGMPLPRNAAQPPSQSAHPSLFKFLPAPRLHWRCTSHQRRPEHQQHGADVRRGRGAGDGLLPNCKLTCSVGRQGRSLFLPVSLPFVSPCFPSPFSSSPHPPLHIRLSHHPPPSFTSIQWVKTKQQDLEVSAFQLLYYQVKPTEASHTTDRHARAVKTRPSLSFPLTRR